MGLPLLPNGPARCRAGVAFRRMTYKRELQEKIEEFFLTVVLGEHPRKGDGFQTRALLAILKQMSFLYRAVVQVRLFLYLKGILRHHTLGCQVISIGNLTVGGTGKTPVVEIFARRLQQAGRRVAILSRGYKKSEPSFAEKTLDLLLLRDKRRPPRIVSDGKTLLLDSTMGGDEPYMLASHLPDVTVLVDKDRVKSGQYAVNKQERDTLILDDGFQYLELKHRVDIVLVDRLNPFGNGHVLPRGILREPIGNIRRADVIFITKCDGAAGAKELKAKLRSLNARAEIIECAHRARYLQDVFSAERLELGRLKDLPVTAMTGIAAPDGFDNELEKRGAKIVHRERFADHHIYTQQQLIEVINRSRAAGAVAVVTTEKDAVRFPWMERMRIPIYFMGVDIELLSGTENFDECISRICFARSEKAN